MTGFLQATFDGLALGAQYALLVLGFVVVFRATGIINLAQGASLLLGAYLVFNATDTWGWNYYLALTFSIVVTAAFSVLLQRAMLQRVYREVLGIALGLVAWAALFYNGLSHAPALAGGVVVGVATWRGTAVIERRWGPRGPSELPPFAAVMVTMGVLLAAKQILASVWGFGELSIDDPWEIDFTVIGKVVVSHAKLATLGLAGIALLAFFIVDRYTKVGVAMRATQSDLEVAIAQGISTKHVFALAFGIAGAVAALAGASATSGPTLLTTNADLVVFLAFPAMIMGGFDSPAGAVVGGLFMGWVQNLAKFYLAAPPSWFPIDDPAEVLGAGFDRVVIFVMMIVVLMVRPYGLFGTEEVRRV